MADWLPRTLRSRLDAAAERAWWRGLRLLLEGEALTAGRAAELETRSRAWAGEAYRRHVDHLAGDDARARTHVAAASRVAGTARACAPFLRGAAAEVLRDNMGAAGLVLLRPLAYGAALLSRDRLALARRALRALRLDYGDVGFAFGDGAAEGDGEGRAVLVVTRCLYADLLDAEGVAGDAHGACCCEQDTLVWQQLFANPSHGVAFRVESSIAAGASRCVVAAERRPE